MMAADNSPCCSQSGAGQVRALVLEVNGRLVGSLSFSNFIGHVVCQVIG
jgi:hypothetical protein